MTTNVANSTNGEAMQSAVEVQEIPMLTGRGGSGAKMSAAWLPPEVLPSPATSHGMRLSRSAHFDGRKGQVRYMIMCGLVDLKPMHL